MSKTKGPDRAKSAAKAVLADLNNRSGFDHWWGDIDSGVKREIRHDLAEAIRKAARIDVTETHDAETLIDVIFPDGTHRYWSTHCRHAGPSPDDPRHADCSADRLAGDTLRDGRALPRTVEIQRKPAQCKTCAAPCICPCHKTTEKEIDGG